MSPEPVVPWEGMRKDIPKNKIYGLLECGCAAFRRPFSMISILDHQQCELRNNVLTRQMIEKRTRFKRPEKPHLACKAERNFGQANVSFIEKRNLPRLEV